MNKRIIAALCAALLLLGSLGALSGCKKDEVTTTQPPAVDDSNTQLPSEDDGVDVSIKPETAADMVRERLPEGSQVEPSGTTDLDGQEYYLFEVSDPEGQGVGTIAIDRENGERYNYDGEKVTEYADFPLYDAANDVEYDWNGVFVNGSLSVELLQADNTQADFSFSDGTQGFARITGNTAATEDGAITFTFEDEKTLLVGGTNSTLAGQYTLK